MIVLDASVALEALSNAGPARELLANEACHVPDIIDLEVASVLRRMLFSGGMGETAAMDALAAWVSMGVVRHPHTDLLMRIWSLRDNVTPCDAAYVALAEGLGAELVTADRRLAGAPGLRCAVRVLPGTGR